MPSLTIPLSCTATKEMLCIARVIASRCHTSLPGGIKILMADAALKFEAEQQEKIDGINIPSATVIARRNPPYPKEGWVYAVGNTERELFKIGATKKFPEDRAREIQTACPFPINVYWMLYSSHRFNLEKSLHSFLARYREHGEWFKISEERLNENLGLISSNSVGTKNSLFDILYSNCNYSPSTKKFLDN